MKFEGCIFCLASPLTLTSGVERRIGHLNFVSQNILSIANNKPDLGVRSMSWMSKMHEAWSQKKRRSLKVLMRNFGFSPRQIRLIKWLFINVRKTGVFNFWWVFSVISRYNCEYPSVLWTIEIVALIGPASAATWPIYKADLLRDLSCSFGQLGCGFDGKPL